MQEFKGSCHCGKLRLTFKSASSASDLPVRECNCTFCRKHGARTMTDPDGAAVIEADAGALNQYQFGLRTADFMVCNNCGANMGAFFNDAGNGYATLNINVLDNADAFSTPAASADYGAEDAAGRKARRRARWTPATLVRKP
jgi:hypothetical protein